MGASLSISLRNGVPAPVRWRCPITSSRVRGRIRTASGAAAWAAVSSASSNRLSDWPVSDPAIFRPYLGSLLYHASDLWGAVIHRRVPAGLGYPQVLGLRAVALGRSAA